MVQWVASPLNQGYSFLTRMSEEGETKEGKRLLIAEKEDGTNLGSSTIHSLTMTDTHL